MGNEKDVESASLHALLTNENLKAVFVGGKGGVGKTTCSCSLALRFAIQRPEEKVLLISTDPAHNVSDAFLQQFSNEPQQVQNPGAEKTGGSQKFASNLWACEVNPSVSLEKDIDAIKESAGKQAVSEEMDQFVAEFRDWVMSVPGIDEAMALSSVLKHMEDGEFGLLVFDTAPTGHTIRLLQLPTVLKIGLEKLQSWKARLGGIFGSVASYIYKDSGAAAQARAMKTIEEKLETYHEAVTKISELFKDQKQTEFVCVANATFLSVYETRRLISELQVSQIACRNVIVNMLMPRAFSKVTPEAGGASVIYEALREKCGFGEDIAVAVKDAVELCGGISRIQEKYLNVLREGVETDDDKSLAITLLPLLPAEVRGVQNLISFSERLLTPDPKLSFDENAQTSVLKPLSELTNQSQSSYSALTGAKFMNKTAEAVDGMEVDDEVIEKIEVGDTVEVHGLQKAPQHNGQRGEVKSVKNDRFEVKLGSAKRPLLIKEANLRRIRADTGDSAEEETSEKENGSPPALSPEILAMVQEILLKPDGIKTMLEHPMVQELKKTDEQVKACFDDIETNGLFAGLRYMSNTHIMGKLAEVAAVIKSEQS